MGLNYFEIHLKCQFAFENDARWQPWQLERLSTHTHTCITHLHPLDTYAFFAIASLAAKDAILALRCEQASAGLCERDSKSCGERTFVEDNEPQIKRATQSKAKQSKNQVSSQLNNKLEACRNLWRPRLLRCGAPKKRCNKQLLRVAHARCTLLGGRLRVRSVVDSTGGALKLDDRRCCCC